MSQENRSRRAYLAAVSAVGFAGLAGCSGNGDGDSPADNESSGDGDSSADNESPTDDTSGETSSGDGAAFDLDLAVDQLPDAFESLAIEFTGFELFTMTGSTLTRESDPVQADLAELASSGAATDLMETTVPAGEYDNITYFIAVTDTTMASDDGEQTFRSGEDGEVLSNLTEPDAFTVASGESITLTAQLSVEDAFDADWKFAPGFSADRES